MNKSIQGNANGIVEQAKQTVANVASDAKAGVANQLEQKVEQAKGVGIEKIETVSDALRGAGEKLEGTGPLPQLAEKAAAGIENLAHFIENKSIGDVFRGIESFAKREPALFLGGAVALGVVAGRFLKSSSRRNPTVGDSYETYGFEGSSEGDFDNDFYMSADELEDDWDTAETTEPMAFESESNGIGLSGSSSTESSAGSSGGTSDWSRTTQPQGSSFGSGQVGSTKGNTEKMPVTQGTIGGGTSSPTPKSSTESSEGFGSKKSDDFFGNKSSR